MFAVDNQRLGDDVLYPEARIQRRERILKDDLQVAPETSHLTGRCGQKIASLEVDISPSGLNEPKNQASKRALARSRFSYQAERFAGLNVEGNVVDSPDVGGEDLCKISDFE